MDPKHKEKERWVQQKIYFEKWFTWRPQTFLRTSPEEAESQREQQTTPTSEYNYQLHPFLWDKIRSLGHGIIFLKGKAWMNVRRFIDRKFLPLSLFLYQCAIESLTIFLPSSSSFPFYANLHLATSLRPIIFNSWDFMSRWAHLARNRQPSLTIKTSVECPFSFSLKVWCRYVW